MNLLDLEQPKEMPEVFYAVIEIPKGSHNKYEMDHETGLIELDRVLYSPFFYPTDYGFIPRTWSQDEDPLDVMVLVHDPTFPGCIVKVRPVALFKMRDEKGVDEKVLAVPVKEPRFEEIKDLEDVPQHVLKEISHFFQRYKELEKGKFSEVLGWEGKESALKLIRECMKRYEETRHV